MFGKFLCQLGMHWFEEEPSEKERLKWTGARYALCNEAVRKGIKHCVRKDCKATRRVYRRGFFRNEFVGGTWRRLSPGIERYMDSLPTPEQDMAGDDFLEPLPYPFWSLLIH